MEHLLIPEHTGEPYIDICLDTLGRHKQALVFVSTKSSAEKAAEDLAKALKATTHEQQELAETVLGALQKPTKQCERLALCVKKGIAFHHAGLHSKQKSAIEHAFRKGTIRIICCTPTLAYGLDLPAYRAVVRDVKRFTVHGQQFIPVLEYLQMAGRAGRPKIDSHGEAILVAKSGADAAELIERYLYGDPEAIYSKLAVEPVLRTALLSLIATGVCKSTEELRRFFARTFWAHQFKDLTRLNAVIDRMLTQLVQWKFITGKSLDDFAPADELSDGGVYHATPVGHRVSELYLDPLTAFEFVQGLDRALIRKTVPFFSWLVLVTSTLEMRPYLTVGKKEWEKMATKVTEIHDAMVAREPNIYEPEFDEFLCAVKTAMLLDAWAQEYDDEFLMEEFNARPGEVRAKLENADWLLYSLLELAQVLGHRELTKELRLVRLRLEYGVKEELLPLLRLEGIGRVRARKLFQRGLRTVEDLVRVDLLSLESLLGTALAHSVKRQVGETVTAPVSSKKRTGQLGLGKFTDSV